MTALRQNPAAGISAVPRRKSALLPVLPVEEVELVCLGDGPEPAWIQGRDVLAAAGGRKPGPWVGELVAAALQRQYRGEFPGRPEALNWLVEAAGAAKETNSGRR